MYEDDYSEYGRYNDQGHYGGKTTIRRMDGKVIVQQGKDMFIFEGEGWDQPPPTLVVPKPKTTKQVQKDLFDTFFRDVGYVLCCNSLEHVLTEWMKVKDKIDVMKGFLELNDEFKKLERLVEKVQLHIQQKMLAED